MEKIDLLKILKYRHACKEFNTKKNVSDKDLKYILECGRLAPSSFGVEPWKFIVIPRDKIIQEMISAAYDQKQVLTCSHLIIVVAKIKDVSKNSKYVEDLFKQRVPSDKWKLVYDHYNHFIEKLSQKELFDWSSKQCSFASSQMMIAAASLEIDSCPMEGFHSKQMLEVLGLSDKEYGISLLLPIGYKVRKGYPKTRKSFDEIVEIK